MPHRLDRAILLLSALIGASATLPSSGAEPGPVGASPTGTVRLASGVTAHYAYQYNRNALAEARIAGDSLIALTDAGSLLRFDRATLRLTKESLGPVPATCLGRGEGGAILVGFADGRIHRIDPSSLATTELARLPGKPQWVGVTASGVKPRLIAVVDRKKPYKFRGTEYQVPSSVVHDTGTGQTYEIDKKDEPGGPRIASTFLLDRKDRLWLGADRGEWGGWCSYVDLGAGRVVEIPGRKLHTKDREPSWLGLYGFVELKDGPVWAFGGTAHMGITEGYIWRVDSGKAEELYRLDNVPLFRRQMEEAQRAAGIEPPAARVGAVQETPFPTDRPCLPVTHVVEEPRTNSLLVVAFSNLYRTDARLARWEKVHELKIGYRWGRPDAVGAYPSVSTVLPVPGPGGSPAWLFATRLDGLVRLAGGKQSDHALPGQFGGESIGRLVNSADGLFALGDSEDAEAWRYRDGGWSPASFQPPYRPHPGSPDAREAEEGGGWSGTKILIGRDGSIVTVSAAMWVVAGTRTTARWRDGKPEILGSEGATLEPSSCFSTPDGTLWSAQLSTLRRFVDSRWMEVDTPDEGGKVPRADWHELKLNLIAVNDVGPPWILHDPDHRMLFRLTYGDGFKDPRLTIESPAGAGSRRFARDAIPWTKTELMVATEDGPRTFAIDGGRLAPAATAIDTRGRSISRLARDGRGRLWLGGEGLAVLDADGHTLHSLDDLPMLGRSRIEALAADPAHPDGAIAAVEGRGIVFVRVEPR